MEFEMWTMEKIFTCCVEQRIQLGQIQQAFVAGDGHVGDLGAGALGQELPGHEIAMMLHFCQQDDIARLQIFHSPVDWPLG